MANLGYAYVDIMPSMRGAQGNITKELMKSVQSPSKQAGLSAGDNINNGIQGRMKANLGKIMTGAAVGAVGAVAAAGVGKQLWGAVMDAGSLEQNLGAAEAIFKGHSDKVIKNSESAAEKVGLSQNAYLEATTALGAGLKNAGYEGDELVAQTDKLIGRGADLASMFGGTTKDAVDAQSAALRGEFEQMEKYGVTLTAATVEQKALEMGLIGAGEEMTDAAKKAATLQLIQDQTKDSTGNFAKEQDTLAGKMQIFGAKWDDLKVAIGEKLLPVMTDFFGFLLDKALPALTDFGSKLEPIGSALGSAFGWLAENKDLWTPFAIGLGVAAVAVGIWAGAAGIASIATAAFGAALAVVTSPITLVILGITLLVGGIILAYNKIGWFKDAVDAAFNWIGVVIGGFFNWITEVVWPGILSALQWIGDKFTWLYENAIKPAWDWIKNIIAGVVTWFTETAIPWIQNAITTIGNVFTWLYQNIVLPVWNAIKVAIAVVVGIVMTYIDMWVWIFRNVLAPVFTWLYNNVVLPVWNGIRSAISAVAQWIMNSLVPFIRSAIEVVGNVFRWLKDNVITPVWNGIKWVISNAWAGIKIYFNAIKWFIDNVLAPVFRWLKDNVIMPVWNGIKNAISAAWSFIRDVVFTPIRNFLRDVLGSAFTFIRDRATNAWNSIKNNLNTVWVFIRDRVFNPLKDGIKNGVVNAFESAKNGIKRVWDGIKNIVKAPIKFVLETVLQNGLIKNINSVLEKVGSKTRIPKVWPVDGWYNGGRTGGNDPREARGLVHGKEFVANHRRTQEADRMAPGFLDDFHSHGFNAAISKHFNPAHMAVGASVYGGAGSFSNPLQHGIYSSGQMNVTGAAPGWGLTNAIRMLDKATSIKVRKGSGSPNNTVHVNAGAYPEWWAGYYSGNSVRLNTNGIGPGLGRQTVATHELGHALGLPHSDPSGLRSIMSYANMYQHNSVTDADVKALSKIYGGSGKGSSGGFFDWIADKLNPVKNFLDGIGKMLNDGLGDGVVSDIVRGVVDKITNGLTDWVKDKIRPFSDNDEGGALPMLHDNGGIIPPKRGVVQGIVNNTGEPEMVLNPEEGRTYKKMIRTLSRGNSGESNNKNNTPAIIIEGNVIATHDIREIAEEIWYEKKMEESVRGL